MKGTGTRDSHFPSFSPLPSFLHISHCFGINMSTERSDRLGNSDTGLAECVCASETENGSGGSRKQTLSKGEFLGTRVVGEGSGGFLC